MAIILLGESGLPKVLDNFAEHRRGRCQIVEVVAMSCMLLLQIVQQLLQFAVGTGIAKISRKILGSLYQPVAKCALLRRGSELLQILPELIEEFFPWDLVDGHSHQGEFHRQQFLFGQVVQRRNQLPFRQVAGNAENHHRTGITWTSLLFRIFLVRRRRLRRHCLLFAPETEPLS